jgi:hypothetical protein
MFMRLKTLAALLLAAATLQTGQAAPTYDVSFVLEQGTYTGTTTFAVSRAGQVTGTMKLTVPTVVDAVLGGTVKENTWTFKYDYTIPEQGCTGFVEGTGTISDDKASVKGNASIGGGCTQEPLTATFTFTKKK